MDRTEIVKTCRDYLGTVVQTPAEEVGYSRATRVGANLLLVLCSRLAIAVIEMAKEITAPTADEGTIGSRYAFLETLAGPEYSPVTSKPVEAFIAERIERLEQQVAEARRLIKDAGPRIAWTHWHDDAERFLAATDKGAEERKSVD